MQATQPLLIGIDWADERHAVCIWSKSTVRPLADLDNTPQAILAWLDQMHSKDRPLAIACEQGPGLLRNVLLGQDNVDYYHINPAALDSYRKSRRVSRAKDDPGDAARLCRLLRERLDELSPVRVADPLSRQLAVLTRQRRGLVQQRVEVGLRLTAHLKRCYPQFLAVADAPIAAALPRRLLRRYPSFSKLRRASASALRRHLGRANFDRRWARLEQAQAVGAPPGLEQIDADYTLLLLAQIELLVKQTSKLEANIGELSRQHPDYRLAASLPGAGKALAPRLLALMAASHDNDATEMANRIGVTPIIKSSGKQRQVAARRAKPVFDHQTLVEFADHSRKKCAWAAAFCAMHKERDPKQSHNTVLRKLACKWARILHRMWRDKEPYDEQRYLEALIRQRSPLRQWIELLAA